MPVLPEIGQKGGQVYDVARAIRSFLQQMAEGGTRVAPAVMKELIQNADDAGADVVWVVLDERIATDETSGEYSPLCSPALVVGNNARFKNAAEVEEGVKDDFSAICDVASGHKRAQATAAGRFGIGFNSVYFLTDLPVIFSRREVHLFDLLHRIFANTNGWKFPLDEFPADADSSVGPLKNVLEWILPKAVLHFPQSFGEIAADQRADYDQAVFRLPLRESEEGTQSLYDDRFGDRATRLQLLYEVTEQAARSLLFLKNVREVSIGVLSDKQQVVKVGHVEISAGTNDYRDFLAEVDNHTVRYELGDQLKCTLPRTVDWWTTLSSEGTERDRQSFSWSFEVRHVARFDNPVLLDLRERLRRNKERAIPWASMAIPRDLESMHIDGGIIPAWRVFLPLDEPGPCACPLSAAMFVGPSRRNNEFRIDGSDEAKRKTEWNKALVERALLPLLREATADFPELCSSLIANSPREYLSLFPVSSGSHGSATCLAEHFQTCFSAEPWVLRVFDLWGEQIDLFVETDGEQVTLEMIPEWLAKYRDRFESLSDDQRFFIPFALGEAIQKRLGETSSVTVRRRPAANVYICILSHEEPPQTGDLNTLLARLSDTELLSMDTLDGLWGLRDLADGAAVRYHADHLYVHADSLPSSGIHHELLSLGLPFENTHWVARQDGLPSLSPEKRRELDNVIPADDNAAFTLLSRLGADSQHDSIERATQVEPVIDFLISQGGDRLPPNLRLGFLIRTAQNKQDRRYLRAIFIREETPSSDDAAMWDAVFRRTFAEVHPDFATPLRRLLNAMPTALRLLDEPDCRVLRAQHEMAFDVLHEARLIDPTIISRIAQDFEAGLGRGRPQATAVTRAAFLLLNHARQHWEDLSPNQQATALALPIHRTSDGTFVSLAEASADTSDTDRTYRLQSEDDLHDAPIDLPECELLQPSDPTLATFYRQQLGLEVHGRTAVLKDVLRQIGSADTDNDTLLEYLAKYFNHTLPQLLRSANGADRDDAEELGQLMGSARTVPCLDGHWRVADEGCTDCSAAVRLLKGQGWKAAQLPDLLAALFHGQPVATANPKLQKLLRQLHDLPEWPAGQVYDLAISSESPDLSLETRCKLLLDNWPTSPPDITRASVLDTIPIPTYGGTNELAACVCVVDQSLGSGVLKHVVPNSVDPRAFGERHAVKPTAVPKLMGALSIPPIQASDVQDQIVQDFPSVWAKLDDDAKFDLLNYVGTQELTEQLHDVAAGLEVVRVADPQIGWATPDAVISPRWLALQPPELPPQALPKVEGLTPAGLAVWERWCGLGEIDDVLRMIIDCADKLPDKRKPHAATRIYQWLDSLTKDESITDSDLCSALQNNRWVFARRRNTNHFRRPYEVLVHEAETILTSEFWVPAVPLPTVARDRVSSIGLQKAPPPDTDSVRRIASCLEHAGSAKRSEVMSVYRMLRDMLRGDESLGSLWFSESATRPVFRLYRTPDRLVSGRELFLGSPDDQDFGEILFCLSSAKDPPSRISALYEDLGVSARPTADHAIFALQQLRGPCSGQLRTYRRLVEILRNDVTERFSHDMLREIGIPTCRGTFEPLGHCYWDEQWGAPGHIHADCASRLIDIAHESTQRLIQFLDAEYPGVVVRLRHVADVHGTPPTQAVEIRATAAQVLGPWQDWFDDLRRSDSMLRANVGQLGFQVSDEPLEIIAVDNLTRQYQLPDGSTLNPSEDWGGPSVEHDSTNTVYVAQEAAEKDYLADPTALQNLDHLIAARVAELMTADQAPTIASVNALTEVVNQTLERPSAVLDRIRQVNESHFFHQYHDQVADPAFAPLFDKFRKTRESTKDYEELKAKMWSILQDAFVKARRDQIRGHGYDEVSVFAELVQNAEDAYVQRHALAMDPIDDPYVSFSYCDADGRVLVVEHAGRPFNCCRHGDREDRNYSRDVEGVLRSAGSYKPLSQTRSTPERTVGRFGLGFKSVYLLTDSPIIHSGQWHFRIDAGCLPKTIPPPDDLNPSNTRIVLPLRQGVQEIDDRHGRRLATLLPFLRCIKRLSLTAADAASSSERESATLVRIAVEKELISGQDGITVELNAVRGVTHVLDDAVRFLRFRHDDHVGQLGIYLGPDDSPAPWHDAFDSDMYAVLPLKSCLGVGVGVSHLLEVQSGRTHLVDPETNRRRFAQVAALLTCIPQVVAKLMPAEQTSEWLAGFWSLWVWDRGDGETNDLRIAIAKALAALARQHVVVPTLAPKGAQRLGDQTLYYFSRVPDAIRDIILQHDIPLDAHGNSHLTREVVVPEAFANAFRRICNVAGDREPEDLPLALTWPAIGELLAASDALASTPELLSDLAEKLPENHADNVLDWLGSCCVSAVDGESRTYCCEVRMVLSYECDGLTHLPRRLLLLLDERYREAAVKLLKKVGLQKRLPAHNIERWLVESLLTEDEAAGLLRFLYEGDRYKDYDYRHLKNSLRTPWYPSDGEPLMLESAMESGRLSADFLGDPEFAAWLGLVEETLVERPLPPEPPPIDAASCLSRLYDWWQTHGTDWTQQYETRTYPGGVAPELACDFRDTTDERRRWLVLLLVGSLHTMGRAKPEQHRRFLELCERRGWMNVFADAQSSAQRWIDVLEQYLDEQSEELPYYQWMMHFVRIFQISRWLPMYVNQFLFINQRERFAMDQILRPAADPHLTGSGETAPELRLGPGACFVLRELIRWGLLDQQAAHRYCYVPVKRVRDTMATFGCSLDGHANPEQSIHIHRFLEEHLDDEKALFGKSFDLPLQALSEDPDLKYHVFGSALLDDPQPEI